MPSLRTFVFISVLLLHTAVLAFSAESDQDDFFKLSVAPGTYNRDIQLQFSAEEGWSLSYSFTADDRGPWISANRSAGLSAMDGETRQYAIRLRAQRESTPSRFKTLIYIIDKTAPETPEPLKFPGTYFEPTEIGFEPRDPLPGSGVLYNVSSSDGTVKRNLRERTIRIEGKAAQSVSYTIDIAGADAAGNVGEFKIYTYTIDRRRERPATELLVYSPVEGRFQNQQYLYLDDQLLREVRYTTDGTDPATSGTPYREGVLIPATGKVQLRIWGRSYSGAELRKNISYEAGIEDLQGMRNGTVSSQFILAPPAASFKYVAGERKVTDADEALDRTLRIAPQIGSLRGIAIRMLRLSDQSEFRYYFVLDGRVPPKPEVWVRSEDPVSGKPVSRENGDSVAGFVEVQANSVKDTRLYYSLDGRLPQTNPQSPGFNTPMRFSVDSIAKNGVVSLILQARQGDGNWGPAYSVDLKAPIQNLVSTQPSMSLSNGVLRLTADPGQDTWLLIKSPFHKQFEGPFLAGAQSQIMMPFGAKADFEIRTASGPRYALGSWSAVKTLSVGVIPPSDPVISIKDRDFSLSGEGKLYYRINSSPAKGPSTNNEFVSYREQVSLIVDPGSNITYTIEAYAEDLDGNRSATVVSPPIALLTRPPLSPQIGTANDGVFWNKPSGDVTIEKPETGVRYYYTVSASATDPDPGRDPFSEKQIHVQLPVDPTKKDGDETFVLSILPVSEFDGTAKGSIKRIPIVYDSAPPSVPKVSGVTGGQSYRDDVLISVSADAGDLVEYKLFKTVPEANTQATEIPYQRYTAPIPVAVPAAGRAVFSLDLRVSDRAGNSTSFSAPIVFVIDKELPAAPILSVVGTEGMVDIDPDGIYAISDMKEFRFRTSRDAQVYFELSEGELLDKTVNAQSPKYLEGLALPDVLAGEDRTFNIRAVAVDTAGNQSALSPVYRIRVDRKAPNEPAEPRISRILNEGELVWERQSDTIIELALVSEEQGDKRFKEVGPTTSWSIPDGVESIVFAYRTRDEAGNTSAVKQISIARRIQASSPLLTGIEDGALYNVPVRVSLKSPESNSTVRYELLSPGQVENGVDASSPAIPQDGLEISPLPGESLRYVLVVRQFAENSEPSVEARFSFTIDRSPPVVPKLGDTTRINYLSGPQTLKFETSDGDTVFYSLIGEDLGFTSQMVGSNDALVLDALGEQGYKKAPAEILIPSSTNGVRHVAIAAYSMDSAGNRSTATGIWEFYVDTETVYVVDSSMIGRGVVETGSRNQPFGDIERAVAFAFTQKKKNIVLSNGNFPIRTGIKLSSDLTITGGYDAREWKQNPDLQTILYPAQNTAAAVLQISNGSRVQLRNLFLIDGGMRVASLIRLENAQLDIVSSSLAVTNSSTAINSIDSELNISATSLSCNDPAKVTLLSLSGGKVSIVSSVIESADLPPVLLKRSQTADYVLIDARDLSLNVKDSIVRPRKGFQTVGLSIAGGTAQIDGGEVYGGQGTQMAVGLDLNGTSLTIRGLKLASDRGARNTVAIRSQKSSIALTSVTMDIGALTGAYGLTASASTVSVEKSLVRNEATGEFATIFSLEGSELKLDQNTFSLSASPDLQLLSIRDSGSRMNNNSFRVLGNTRGTSPFMSFSGQGNHRIEDNVFSGDDVSTLMYIGSQLVNVTLRSNVLERWRLLLQIPQENLVRQSEAVKGISTIDELEALERKGSLFEGNRIRQGL